MSRIILAMDSHALSAFQMCPMKFWLGYVRHMKARPQAREYDPKTRKFSVSRKKNALDTGTFIHDMMYRVARAKLRQRDGKIPFDKFLSDNDLLQLAYKRIARNKLSTEDKLFHMQKFTEYYAVSKTTNDWFKPLGAEVGFSKVIYEDNDVCFLYEGRIDLIGYYERDGSRYNSWVDYKSQSREYGLYKNPNQFLGYSWAIGTNMGFVQYYGLQKNTPKERCFRLEPVYHAPELIAQWRKDTIREFRTVAGLIQTGEKFFTRRRTSCNQGFYPCRFIPLCDNAYASKEITEGMGRMLYRIEKWSPWKAEEPEEELEFS